jgi:uncharacterized protein YjbI with pentapeptide repeats
MSNNEHLKTIKQGVRVWNAWREENPLAEPDLSRADLRDASLAKANLVWADLREAYLYSAIMCGADLSEAYLVKANLCETNLKGANLSKANLSAAYLASVNLSSATIQGANLNSVWLTKADLSGADLRNADLSGADLYLANLDGANLSGANLSEAFLSDANLRNADLSDANLNDTNLGGATIGRTIFGNNDLRTVIGLETIHHSGPSTIGIDTLFKSDGGISEVFLREAGVPEDFITFVPSFMGRAIEFYSCFISYSHQDEQFSERLHSRMRQEKLRVWYAPEDIKGGRKLHEEIFRAIQIHDKLLLVLSEDSMKSEWVMTEIRRARKIERDENRRKLFPIRLVDFEAIQRWECFDADSGRDLAIEVREYYIPDFSKWKDHDAFEAEFAKLLRDLKATEG